MKLPKSAHTSMPWRIHEIAPDFELEDVWALPTPGGPDDLPRLVRQIASGEPSQGPNRFSGAARALWAIRWKVGGLLGWDSPDGGLGSRVPTLRDRLPADLREAPPGPRFDALPFASLYLLDDEFAAEIANRTVHGVMHIGWVPDGTGGHRGQMAVLVKPNGPLGAAYMAAIGPFRHLIVYPALMRQIGRGWRECMARDARTTGGEAHGTVARKIDRRARILAAGVGWVSLGIGLALTLAPRGTSELLGWGDRPALARAVGAADLVVGPALLLGRERGRWMEARALLNAAIAVAYARALASGATPRKGRALGGVVGMTVLTFTDHSLARRLRKTEGTPDDVGG